MGCLTEQSGTTGAPPLPKGTARAHPRVRVRGKLFCLGEERWYLKGYTYGPFAKNEDGFYLPTLAQMRQDFAQLKSLGANAIRLYHVPPVELLDAALEFDLRVFVDVPWEKHRCFFEDWSAQADAVAAVRSAARQVGAHPATLAISVANEIPHDVVRFYGADRVAKFIEKLLATVHEESPDCPATYTNYPSTEFLVPRGMDFFCINVYLNDAQTLGRYLDRLQHVAGSRPLVLGEIGADAIRNGEEGQAQLLGGQLEQVFRRGLAGSFVFSYTDDWFTGGHAVEDWAFGVTDRDREAKPSAGIIRDIWSNGARVEAPPRVSVVVCSYNGAATLDECLQSLTCLDYPDYEVLLVDDGSTDNTPAIAARYPMVRYIRQRNLGLSAARNTGMREASGNVIAYTDSDCVADPTWLLYLIASMQDQKVEAIGGPNVPPPSDNWIAKCVAASPGGPSHVMLDDRLAEHVPGCNMAFDRATLMKLGGFDPQFRAAGDDVDICWRFLDAGCRIGYAASALVWHHRRNTVRAYLKQQKGYGVSEAMLHGKHRHRFNLLGCSKWSGIIYGEGAIGLPSATPAVYHGRFGGGPFQIIYRNNRYSGWVYVWLLEWHLTALLLLALTPLSRYFALVAAAMWLLSAVAIVRAAASATLPAGAPWWCRPLVGFLHFIQPVIRAWPRYVRRLRVKRMQLPLLPRGRILPKATSWRTDDLYWSSSRGRGRESLLDAMVKLAPAQDWRGDFHGEWYSHDLELWPDVWHVIQLRTATEELGEGRRFTRLRSSLHLTRLGRAILTTTSMVPMIAAAIGRPAAAIAAGVLLVATVGLILDSRRRCRRAVCYLAEEAGAQAGLDPVETIVATKSEKMPAKTDLEHSQLAAMEI